MLHTWLKAIVVDQVDQVSILYCFVFFHSTFYNNQLERNMWRGLYMDSACPMSNPFQSLCLNKIFQNPKKSKILFTCACVRETYGGVVGVNHPKTAHATRFS